MFFIPPPPFFWAACLALCSSLGILRSIDHALSALYLIKIESVFGPAVEMRVGLEWRGLLQKSGKNSVFFVGLCPGCYIVKEFPPYFG